MSKKSREIHLHEAAVGMQLASDLVDQYGTVLLQGGSVLTGTLLAALSRRGVARVRVLDERDGDDLPDVRRARLQTRLAHLFRNGAGGADAELRAELEGYRMEAP